MLTTQRITRLASTGAYDRLLEDVLANGRPLAAPARARLRSNPTLLPVIALSLAVIRVAELAYREDRELRRLVTMLQDRVGAHSLSVDASPLACSLVQRAHREVERLNPRAHAA